MRMRHMHPGYKSCLVSRYERGKNAKVAQEFSPSSHRLKHARDGMWRDFRLFSCMRFVIRVVPLPVASDKIVYMGALRVRLCGAQRRAAWVSKPFTQQTVSQNLASASLLDIDFDPGIRLWIADMILTHQLLIFGLWSGQSCMIYAF